jgi:uncharacterized membrane protein YphA (DoxX/SURF4 family)
MRDLEEADVSLELFPITAMDSPTMTEHNACSTSSESKCPINKFFDMSPESWAFLALRIFIGLRMLLAGLMKFRTDSGFSFDNYYHGFVSSQIDFFSSHTFLPKWTLWPYLNSLAYLEILFGILLLVGIRVKMSLTLTALLLISIAFGVMLLPTGSPMVADIGVFLGLTCFALLLAKHHKCPICCMIFGKKDECK